MTRPSEPLLALLRAAIERRGWNTAAVAARANLDRQRVRKVLSGAEPLTVDELLTLSQALELSPQDLGLPPAVEDVAEAAPFVEEEDDAADEAEDPRLGLNPWGNHPEQLVRAGFELGCDFMLFLDVSKLDDSGVPAGVLERYRQPNELPIRLDAMYHQYNAPIFEAATLTLTLSFDALYDCHLPWQAITRVLFFPVTPELPEEVEEEPEPPTPAPGAPFLRLV